MRVMLNPGDTIINCPPTFGMYAFDADLNNARVVNVPRKADFSLDVDGILAAAEKFSPKLIFLTSPNNPDGSLIPPPVLQKLLTLPALIVLDEAYIEFAGRHIRTLPVSPDYREPDRPAHLQQTGRAGRAARRLWRLPDLADAHTLESQTAL